MKFSDLRLAEPILRAVSSEGYEVATPIQAQAIPHVIDGKDVLGCAQTGTGKTAAFALPILHRLSQTPASASGPRKVRCLVLSPTRELALQIADSFRTYGKNLSLRHTVIFGGVNQHGQVQALKQGIDIVVATPGRLLDLMNQRHVDIRNVEVLVLDEADRMLDMGFIHDIRKITEQIPKERQTLLFSATMPTEIRQLANSILNHPVTIQVAPVSSTADQIEESVYFVEKRNKPALLAHLFEHLPMSRVIVFTRTKHGADRVVRHLHAAEIRAEAIHGNKSQNARERALKNFRAGKTPMLIATDIASRGIDVDDISHVVNYDLTHEPETYVHRIGRTARAGASGKAVSFCDRDEVQNLKAIERLIRRSIPVCKDHPEYPKHEPAPHAPPKHGGTHKTPARHHQPHQHQHVHPDQRQRPQKPRSMHQSGMTHRDGESSHRDRASHSHAPASAGQRNHHHPHAKPASHSKPHASGKPQQTRHSLHGGVKKHRPGGGAKHRPVGAGAGRNRRPF